VWRGLVGVLSITACGRFEFEPHDDAAIVAIACPEGFVGVPGNAALGTSSFCAMRFEAKAWSDANGNGVAEPVEVDVDGCNEDACPICDDTCSIGWPVKLRLPVATSHGIPWRNATAFDARAACQTLGAGFDVMSNREWMTIARDAELVGANWSGNAPGSGRLVEGNTDSIVQAVSDPNDGYSDTGNSAAEPPGGGWEQRRTLVLSNGNVIWDMPGNMQEWIDWTIGGSLDGPPVPCVGAELPSFSCSGFAFDDFNSSTGVYDSSFGVGQVLGGSGDAARRGGQQGDRSLGIAGIYGLNMNRFSTQTFPATTFRCVYRP
jgi:hypothetical protein